MTKRITAIIFTLVLVLGLTAAVGGQYPNSTNRACINSHP